jgi:hypothetical protein
MLEDIAKHVVDEIAKGRGATVILNYRGKPHRIAIVPSPLFTVDGEKIELLIACEGKGAHFYDGQTPLNQFKLISSGYPIDVARQVEKLVSLIMQKARTTPEQETLVKEQPKQIKARADGEGE